MRQARTSSGTGTHSCSTPHASWRRGARETKVLARLDLGLGRNAASLSKPLPDADRCTASTDGDVSSDPAGQDVSQELDAVHGPRLWTEPLAPVEPAIDR